MKTLSKTSLIIIFLFLTTFLYPQVPDSLWSQILGYSYNNERAFTMRQTSDEGFIICGSEGGDILLLKTDSLGNPLWSKTYGGSGNEYGTSIEQTLEGGYILAGMTTTFMENNLYLIKTDSIGDTLWTRLYGESSAGGEVIQLEDSNFVVLVSDIPYSHLIKVNQIGETLWVKDFPPFYYQDDPAGYSFIESSDGGFVITYGINGIQLIKTDANGDSLWHKTYGPGSTNKSYALQETPNGDYVIVGEAETNINLIKTDSQGNLLWDKILGAGSARFVEIAADSGYVIIGTQLDQIHIIKTDSDGNQIWTKSIGTNSADVGICIQRILSNEFILVGNTYVNSNDDILLIKLGREKIGDLSFDPPPGNYNSPQSIQIFSNSTSIQIYYTLDGSEPNQNSSLYTGPVFIDTSLTLKAKAYKYGFESSPIKTGIYYITPAVNIVIETEPIWLDSDYNAQELNTVDGSQTSISYGNIVSYDWLLNGVLVANGPVAQIQLPSGSKFITLRVTTDLGQIDSDSVMVSVYAASLQTNGPITSAIGQLSENIFFATSADDQVYRFDSTGFVNWTILTGGDIQSTTCISNQNNIYVGSSDTRLYAFDSEGTPKWDRAMGGVIVSSPSISNDSMIYVGVSTGRLFAVSESGLIQWNYQTGGAIYSSPSVSVSGDVFVGSDDGKLYSISKDGDLNWSFTTIAPIQSSPAIGNDSTIVFGSDDGSVYKLNNLGGLVWSFDAGSAVKSSPVIDNTGQIYFGSENGKIYCLTSDGNLVWEYNAGGSIFGSPALTPDGSIIIGNNNGKLLVISGGGEELWYLQTQAAVRSPVLYTDNDLVVFGQNSGAIYIIKYPLSENFNPGLISAAEWPTFKGTNKRTGNKLEIISDVEINNNSVPSEYSMLQNYPNPFNSATTIQYSVPQISNVTLKIYDILGNEITSLVNEEKDQGVYTINFDANNLASGLYLYRIQAGSFFDTKKMILLK